MAYTLARTMDEALEVLRDPHVRVVAGGTDFYPARTKGQPVPDLLDITRVEGLRGISATPQGWRIGGATTWSDVIATPLPAAFDGLKAAAREVGSVQIQNVATVAGNLCNASPAADGVPPLLTLNAQVELSSRAGPRVMPLADFITGVRKTQLRQGEIVTALLIPALPDHVTGTFEKLGARRYLVISITMVAALIGLDADGRINFARLAIGACAPTAQRQHLLEKILLGQDPAQVQVVPDHLEGLAPIDDIRSDAGFRVQAAAIQCSRAIRKVAR